MQQVWKNVKSGFLNRSSVSSLRSVGPTRTENVFSQDHVDILSRIRELIHVRGQSIDEVKLELKDVLNRSDSPQDIFQPVEGNIKESAL